MSSVVARSVTAPVGHAAGPEEPVDRPVAQRLHGLADAELALGDVLVGVEAGDLQQPQRDHLGARARRADRDRPALHVLDRLDARVGLDDDLGDVRVQRRERPQRQRLARSSPALDGVDRAVGERERDVGVAVGDQHAGCRPTPRSSRRWSASRAARRSAGRRARRRRPGRRRRRRRWRSRAGPRRRAGRSASTPRRARPAPAAPPKPPACRGPARVETIANRRLGARAACASRRPAARR